MFDAGGSPTFLDCRQLRRIDPNLFLGCRVADRCASAACPGTSWMQIVGEVSLPVSFLKPAGSSAASALDRADILQDGTSTSGLPITPDLQSVLVSKDVGSERWAITRHMGDQWTAIGPVTLPLAFFAPPAP